MQQIALVGDASVGKTSIVRFLQGEDFQEDYVPTTKVESHEITPEENHMITVIDTPGGDSERKDVIQKLRGVSVVFVCFDVANVDSFDTSTQWLDDIKKQIKAQLSVCLIACKIDLTDDRAVTQEQALEFIENYPNVEYLEISVLSGEGLDILQQKLPLPEQQELQSERIQEQEKEKEQIRTPSPQQQTRMNQSQSVKSQQSVLQKEEPIWRVFDFLFPSGRVAKLVKITDVNSKNLPLQDMLFKLQLNQSYPVVNLIGAKETNRGKFYAGIARACFNTDAVVVDSAISTGIEKYTIRRGVKLIGVAPESEVKYPTQQSNFVDPYEISNGHTHIFLVNNKEKSMFFGLESQFKVNLCKKLSEGKVSKSGQRECQKVVHILLAEQEGYLNELQQAVMANHPIIVVKGSGICDEYFQNFNNPKGVYSEPTFGQLVKRGHFYGLNSLDSEDIAQYVHFFLTVTPYI